jgi:hypothetical protein
VATDQALGQERHLRRDRPAPAAPGTGGLRGDLIRRHPTPRWELPSRYARTSPAEDFAESYRAFIEGRLGACCAWRAAWLREVVPRLAEYEGRARTGDASP